MATIQYNKDKIKARLLDVQERFCQTFGVEPKEIVVEEFNFEKEFRELLDCQIKALRREYGRALTPYKEQEAYKNSYNIVSGWKGRLNGRFKNAQSDKVFIYPEHMSDDLTRKSTMVHESLHGYIFDYLNGRGESIVTFKNPQFNETYARRLMQEMKYKTLGATAMYRVSQSQFSELFQYNSFEERFIIYNTFCFMLKEEFECGRPKLADVVSLTEEYVYALGLYYKNLADYEVENIYARKMVKLSELLPSVYDLCEAGDESIERLDRLTEAFSVEEIRFEARESIVPQIAEELVSVYLKTENKDLRKRLIGNVVDKYKRFGGGDAEGTQIKQEIERVR